MPFEIIRNDITNVHADAIVNTADPHPVIGAGTDSRIHEKAGPRLLAARQRIGDIQRGCSAITPAYRLPAKYVIHTVGPVWEGGSSNEEKILKSCYESALQLAQGHGCKSIAFPLISTGNYGFPRDKALTVAISVFSAFLSGSEMHIYLVVFDRSSYKLSEKLFTNVASYIDQNYVDACTFATYTGATSRRVRSVGSPSISRRNDPEEKCLAPCEAAPLSLEELLKQEDAGFTETLLSLIDKTGKKDSEIYKKANISKQHFSKIRNNPNYKPTKATALAFAIALELDLDATRDLIGRAGFALTNSSKFDLIIRYFIETKNYNIVEINIALYEFDQSLLGA